ncbi:unnamed protein product, partial [marine sediment metagenome]
SVWMSNADAKKYFLANKKLGLKLSIHAPYYINLNSKDKNKIEKSKKRILSCCERGHYMGADKVVFHPGYYGGMDKEKTFQNIKKAILDIQKEIKKNKWNVRLAPEVMGKLNVFGSVDEISRLKRETGCSFCIDFAHVLAREKKIDFNYLFRKFNVKNIHCHISGIEYGEKGEKHHKLTPSSFIKKVITECKRRRLNVTLINESPDPVGDSLKTLKMV